MAKLIDKSEALNKKIGELCTILGHEPVLIDDGTGKVVPHYEINASISKMIALLVFAGLNVPVQALQPPYNQVHADIEYWKKIFEAENVVLEP